ncbi:hypothetical protein B0H13DRAFT_2383931 [Mycena leptocephala]|nr:hypothetical protein B0H13DRAFT_2383931 [Mycena leptocephala]
MVDGDLASDDHSVVIEYSDMPPNSFRMMSSRLRYTGSHYEEPSWPAQLRGWDQLQEYLLCKRTVTMANALYTVDFHKPEDGRGALDRTAFTEDNSLVMFWFTLFGRVRRGVSQTEILMKPVVEDQDRSKGIMACTDGDWKTGKGGTRVVVHTDHRGTSPCDVHFVRGVGDVVIVEATLHRRVDPVGKLSTAYEVLARHVRRVDESETGTEALMQKEPDVGTDASQEHRGSSLVPDAEQLTPTRSGERLAGSGSSTAERLPAPSTPKKTGRTKRSESSVGEGMVTRAKKREREGQGRLTRSATKKIQSPVARR